MIRSAFGGAAGFRLRAIRQEPQRACRIRMHKSLLNVVLLDQLPDHNAEKPLFPLSREHLQPGALRSYRSLSERGPEGLARGFGSLASSERRSPI